VRDYDRYVNINSATTTQVKTGKGTLQRIVFNKLVAAATVTIVDNVSGTTPVIALFTLTADLKPFSQPFNTRFSTGLRIITSAAVDITVVYE
jgi:hypothetical protein